jgi:hypothetical protein
MDKAAAKAKLEATINDRIQRSTAVIAQIDAQVPADTIVKGSALQFSFEEAQFEDVAVAQRAVAKVEKPRSELVVTIPSFDFKTRFHAHARDQVSERAGIPLKYTERLVNGDDWQRDLLAYNLAESYKHTRGKYLVRQVNGQARGFLSDSYKPIDSRPVAMAVLEAIKKAGGYVYGGSALDTKVALRAIHPDVFEVLPGEWVAFGGSWSNSDFGDGKNAWKVFLERLVCLNGMTGQTIVAQIHLGARLEDDGVVFSRRTHRLDQARYISAMSDAVKVSFTPQKREQLVAQIRGAAAQDVTSRDARARLAKALTKTELAKTLDTYEGPDVVNVPAGQTTWRLSNALSFIAQAKDVSPARRLELEQVAGNLLNGSSQTE